MKRYSFAVLLLLTFCLTAFAAPVQHTVSLTCTASTSTGVTGYNFYRALTPGGEIRGTPLNTTPVATCAFTDSTVSGGTPGGAGVTYYYVATAVCPTCVDAQNNPAIESLFSNEVSALVPAPPPVGPPNAPTNLNKTVN